MIKRILLLLLFWWVAMLLSPFFIFKWQQEYNPFPESWLELLAGVVCVAVFAVTLWLEYKLWCRWGLHLPPPAKPQLRNTYSLYAAAKQEPPPSAEAEAAKRRYKYRSLFPCFLVAVICCSLGTFFSRKDEDFFHAVEYGYFCTADMLLSMGADVDSRGQLAYRCMGKNKEQAEAQVRYLLERGADPNLNNGFGDSAVTVALHPQGRYLLPLLLQYGGDLRRVEPMCSSMRPVYLAAHEKNPEFMRYLLENGADPNERNPRCLNQVPLHELVDSVPDSEDAAARAMACIRLLLQYGADVNAVYDSRYSYDEYGRPQTPLDCAMGNCGFSAAIPLLHEHGAKRAEELKMLENQ